MKGARKAAGIGTKRGKKKRRHIERVCYCLTGALGSLACFSEVTRSKLVSSLAQLLVEFLTFPWLSFTKQQTSLVVIDIHQKISEKRPTIDEELVLIESDDDETSRGIENNRKHLLDFALLIILLP